MTQAEFSRRNKQVLLRLSPDVIAALKRKAAAARMTVSDYVASLVQGSK